MFFGLHWVMYFIHFSIKNMLLLLSNFILLVSIGMTRSQSTHTDNTDLFQICLVARFSLRNLPRTLKIFFLKNKMNCVAVVNESRFSIYLMLFCCSYFLSTKETFFQNIFIQVVLFICIFNYKPFSDLSWDSSSHQS